MNNHSKILMLILFTMLSFELSYGQIGGIIASYNFNGDVLDQSGNGNNGQLAGNATANGVLKLGNNISNYLILPPSIIDGISDFSISFKVNFNGFHKTGSFPTNHIITGSSPTLDRLGLAYERVNLTWRLALNGAGYTFPDLLFVNTWYCVVLSREGNLIKLYVDGDLLNSYQGNSSPIPCISLLVGQEEDCSGGCFAKNQCTNGKLDDLTFYNQALTSSEVLSICNSSMTKEQITNNTAPAFLIYPNPAHDFINLSLDDGCNVEIFNSMGLQIGSYKSMNKIDVSSFEIGIYFLKITGSDGKIVAQTKFIKE